MSTPPNSPVPGYSTVYIGAVIKNDGSFDHFLRNVTPLHQRNGYWRFASEAHGNDDLRAYQRGFQCPEDVLEAEDRGDGPTDDIRLHWVTGNVDTFRFSREGTAAQHLQCIAAERNLLGKQASFRGRIPQYPVDTEKKLLEYRQRRHLQSNLSQPLNSTTSLQRVANDALGLITSSASEKNPSQNEHSNPASLGGIQRTTLFDLNQPRRFPGVSASTNATRPTTPYISPYGPLPSQSLLFTTGATSNAPLSSVSPRIGYASLQTEAPIAMAHSTRTSEDKDDEHTFHSSTSAESSSLSGGGREPRGSPLQNANELSQEIEAFTLQMTEDSISDETNDALFFCMDCGNAEGHKYGCNIGNIKPLSLNALQLRRVADLVEKFDPGPWTRHRGDPPTPEPEDYATKVIGMAEIIRNEDSYRENPDLHELPDIMLIIAWAAKTSENMDCEVVRIDSTTPTHSGRSSTEDEVVDKPGTLEKAINEVDLKEGYLSS